jgi:hypothetical protein
VNDMIRFAYNNLPHCLFSHWPRAILTGIALTGCLLAVAYAQADPRVIMCIFKWEQAPDFAGGVGVYMIVTEKAVIVSDHDLDRALPQQKVSKSFHFDRPANDWKCGDPHKAPNEDMYVRRCARLVSRAGNSIVMDFKDNVTDSSGRGAEAQIEFRIDLSTSCEAYLIKANRVRLPTPFRDLPEGGRVGPMRVKQQTCQFVTS